MIKKYAVTGRMTGASCDVGMACRHGAHGEGRGVEEGAGVSDSACDAHDVLTARTWRHWVLRRHDIRD